MLYSRIILWQFFPPIFMKLASDMSEWLLLELQLVIFFRWRH